jgi:hypothetical protein
MTQEQSDIRERKMDAVLVPRKVELDYLAWTSNLDSLAS